MRAGFYPKLAREGIRKNKRLYFPYIITGCVMVMMYYILSFLAESPTLERMKGGSVLMMVLPMGGIVIAVFSALFLFYTNSFLVKQRYREFGLYNILGMDKKNICKIMMWENLFVAFAAIVAGMGAGIVLSKAAELVLMNLLGLEINYGLSIGVTALGQTVKIYAVIYLLLLMVSLLKVWRSKPLELMQSSRVGERIPKRTWIFAVVGLTLLTAAYYLAVSIREPLTALLWFFIAVLLVIGGTYLLFIAGSVVFCRLLQSSRKYYYQPNHFVSVASMVYRMKRNGAGLASICILLTMVLIMISSTASLYFGAEDAVRYRCPNGVNISTNFYGADGISDENIDRLRETIRQYSGSEADLRGVRTCEVPGVFTEEGIVIDFENASEDVMLSFDLLGYLSVVSLEDYNAVNETDETLADDECLLFSERLDLDWKTFTMEYGKAYKVKEQSEDFPLRGDHLAEMVPTVFVVVKDVKAFVAPIADMKNTMGESFLTYDWSCGFDVAAPADEREVAGAIDSALPALRQECGMFSHYVESREVQRAGFYDAYGSLFFLGIMLSIVFLMAAVLIIYYKQICEGYEDHARFEIMQKVGMTKRDIRRSINSQMLTVFFLPLLFAGMHLAFAFPFVIKILKLFSFDNVLLSVGVNLACFTIFGIFYAFVYKITSGAYYAIVSGVKYCVSTP